MAAPADIARQYVEAWNRRDWDTFRAVLHPDYTYMGGDGEVQNGPDAALAIGPTWAAALPDGKLEFTRTVFCGNLAGVEFVAKGTNTGPFMGLAPTGKPVAILVGNIMETKDDKIFVEHE